MLQLLKRTALALLVVVGGLILAADGVSFGVWIALVGGAVLVNLLAPWPWNMGWRKMRE